jgi:hypothetical protein
MYTPDFAGIGSYIAATSAGNGPILALVLWAVLVGAAL